MEEVLESLENTPVGSSQKARTILKCGMAIFSAGLSAPMQLYDFDSEQPVGRVVIPDEVIGSRVPQSFCDPGDGLEIEMAVD